MITAFIQDVRYALRMLANKPLFTAMAILSLSLGIGANTTIYSLLDSILLRPLPVEEPERLVAFMNDSISYPVYKDLRDQNEVLSGLASFTERQLGFVKGNQPEVVSAGVVTGNYFDVLGVRAALGRTFLPEEDQTPGANAVAVISHGLWQRRFGGELDVMGKSFTLNNQSFTVIGVAPPGFRGTRLSSSPDLWVPIMMWPRLATGYLAGLSIDSRNWSWMSTLGRLKPGISLEQAQTAFNMLAESQKQEHPKTTSKDFSMRLRPINEGVVSIGSRGDTVLFVWLLMAVAGVALMIACANVANLLLARAVARRKEMSIRMALGASRGRIIRQLLTESLLLSLLGGGAGLLVAFWAADLLSVFEMPGGIELGKLGFSLNGGVLAFTFLLSLITGGLFGLAPAFQASKPDLAPALKDQVPGLASGRALLRNSLVAAQIGLCLLLLVGAGLLVRSLQNAIRIDPGFNPRNVAMAAMNLGLQGYKEAQAVAFYEQLGERVASTPGVQSVSLATLVPISPFSNQDSFAIPGYQKQPDERLTVETNFVWRDYFRTMEIPLLEGREFESGDAEGAARVVVISEAMAKRYWPGQSALGKTIKIFNEDRSVVGVAKDSKYQSLREEPKRYLYLPVAQMMREAGLSQLNLLVRTSGDTEALLGAIEREAHAIDSNLPVFNLKSLEDHLGDLLMAERFGATLLSMFGLLALALAVAGIYGVVAYGVNQRAREFAVRQALGADRSDIFRHVVGRGLVPVFVGIAAGLGASFALTRVMSSFLYDLSATDPVVFAGASLTLIAVAVSAMLVPARRATRIDPMVALRHE
jgi:predicted permease